MLNRLKSIFFDSPDLKKKKNIGEPGGPNDFQYRMAFTRERDGVTDVYEGYWWRNAILRCLNDMPYGDQSKEERARSKKEWEMFIDIFPKLKEGLELEVPATMMLVDVEKKTFMAMLVLRKN